MRYFPMFISGDEPGVKGLFNFFQMYQENYRIVMLEVEKDKYTFELRNFEPKNTREKQK